MRTLHLFLTLIFVAVLPLTAGAAVDGVPSRALAFYEMQATGNHVLRAAEPGSKCACNKLGVCGQQQPLGTDGHAGCFYDRPLKDVMRPLPRSLGLQSHIPELDPPPPKSLLC